MMYEKAILFNDLNSASKIMMSSNPREQKKIGRTILNFNQQMWDERKFEIVCNINFLKFSQNDYLKKLLKRTAGKLLVEASPTDKIWGIGRSVNDKLCLDKKTWNGQNLLGKAITQVRLLIFQDLEDDKNFDIKII